MKKKRLWWRRYWPVALLLAAAGAAVGAYLLADALTREPPNYSRIEDGLYLGGSVAHPPAGTGAVLNLCEVEDGYRAAADHRWSRSATPNRPPTSAGCGGRSNSSPAGARRVRPFSSIAATAPAAGPWS
jgi:hypothetical protein